MRCFFLAWIAVGLVGCGRQMLYGPGSDELGKAVASGSTEAVGKLLGNPNQKVPIGEGSPMHIAAGRGDVAMLDFLTKHGGEVDLKGGNFDSGTPLGTAAEEGKLNAVKFLLAKGANPNGLGAKGELPLSRAATIEIARYLLDHGADINAKDKYRGTALMSSWLRHVVAVSQSS
jgi:ankyrin repeat protein